MFISVFLCQRPSVFAAMLSGCGARRGVSLIGLLSLLLPHVPGKRSVLPGRELTNGMKSVSIKIWKQQMNG